MLAGAPLPELAGDQARPSLGRDAVNLIRPHLSDIATAIAFLTVWTVTTATCTGFLADLFDSMHIANSVAVSVGVTVFFWVATWMRYTRLGLIRDFGSAAMLFVIGAWLLAGIVHPTIVNRLESAAGAWSVVGCMCLVNLIVVTALEERRSGSRTGHTLYRFFDSAGKLLYVGRTNSPKRRFSEHREDKGWFGDIAVRELVHYSSFAALVVAERKAIQAERPRYNVVHNKVGKR